GAFGFIGHGFLLGLVRLTFRRNVSAGLCQSGQAFEPGRLTLGMGLQIGGGHTLLLELESGSSLEINYEISHLI
ncbi:MAG TPA: hypothetical protein VGE47_15560, partial [Burkholderiaceae bacterium]